MRRTSGIYRTCALAGLFASTLTLTAAMATHAAPPTAPDKSVPAAKAAPTPTPAGPTAVLPLSEGPQLTGEGKSGYWTPKAADLKRLEADTPPAVKSYYRQYIGITRDGARLIFIEGFSPSMGAEFDRNKEDWRHRAIMIMDGGTGVFRATYNPHTRKFVGPEYNGVA